MKKIIGYITIPRPINLLLAFLSIFIGGFICGSLDQPIKLILACFSGVFIMAGANTINDYFDIEIDRINKPKRPLPTGLLTPMEAYVYSLSLFLIGIILGAFIHRMAFCIAFLSSALLYIYSWKLKNSILLGNITVAFFTGLALVYGGLALGNIRRAVVVGIIAFLFHLSREIIKDIQDIEGDRALGIQTLPIRYNVKTALVWATVVIFLLIVFTLMPYFYGIFSLRYLIVVILGVDLFFVYITISMWRRPNSKNLGRLSFLMKIDIFIALLAVYLGR
jgi:geranylgeranylglycerol-phosphate geranylgeranyltransferase